METANVVIKDGRMTKKLEKEKCDEIKKSLKINGKKIKLNSFSTVCPYKLYVKELKD